MTRIKDLEDPMHTEGLVLEVLSKAWNMFLSLESQHPDELNDFKEGIHKCQSILALRFAREYRPDVFPKKSDNAPLEAKVEDSICIHRFGNHMEFKRMGDGLYLVEKCVDCGYEMHTPAHHFNNEKEIFK